MSLKSEKAWKKWTGAAAQCPICGLALESGEGGLTCKSGHHFDLSRQGSVQLMPGSSKASTYDASLFAARRRMLAMGLFTPALEAALPLMEKAVPPGRLWLDAGCGEGWATAFLHERLPGRLALGLDLAAPGIRMAAAAWGGEILWAVSDLARLPLQDGAAAVVVNLLSPAHYGEFRRVLGEKGLLIKWIPGSGHLEQLRQAAGLPLAEESRALAFFHKNCRSLGLKRIVASMKVQAEDLPAAVAMAPFTQHRRQKALAALAGEDNLSLTSDLYLAWGHVKEKREGEGLL